MKILIFVHVFFPDSIFGTETYTLNIAKHVQSLGHEVTVVTGKKLGEKKNQEFLSEYYYEGLRVLCLDKNHLPAKNFSERLFQEGMREPLRGILKENSPDLVHVTHLLNHTAVLLEVAKELNIPVVGTLTDFWGVCFKGTLMDSSGSHCPGPSKTRINCIACGVKMDLNKRLYSNPFKPFVMLFLQSMGLLKLSAFLLKLGSQIPLLGSCEPFFTSKSVESRPELLRKLYHNYDSVITQTSFLNKTFKLNGFDIPMFGQRSGVDVSRQAKPVREESEPIQFGFIGRIVPLKGAHILVEAFSEIKDAHLHFYGKKDQIPEYFKRLQIQGALAREKISFHPPFPSDKVGQVMAALDFLVIPSCWHENGPLVLLEALATHTPVIVSDVEGMTEFVRDGINGFLFKMGDKEALANVLRGIVADKQKSRQMTWNTNYDRTAEDMARDVLDVYHHVLSKGRAAGVRV